MVNRIAGYSAVPEAVVRKAVELMKVSSSSVVYDVGAGDGRFAIECAKISARKISAIEVDPLAIKLMKANLQLAGVEGRVSVIEGDALDCSYRDATHVFLTTGKNVGLVDKIYDDVLPGTLIMTPGHEIERFTKVSEDTVSIQGSIYDLSISIRNFDDVSKLYGLTVQELVEGFPSRLQYFWAGPFWNSIFIYRKEK